MDGWRRIVLCLALLTGANLACTLGRNTPTVEPQSRPLVLLLAPTNGSTFAEGTEVALYAIAQHTPGVARIEFRVDDIPVGEVTAETPQTSLMGTVMWQASGQTGHLITAEAFLENGGSLGINDVTVKVIAAPNATLPPATDAAADVAASPVPADTAVPLPSVAVPVDGPVARITNNEVNVRQGPGTTYPTVGVLNFGDEAIIMGRNEDSSWWAISFGGGTAWIFAALTDVQDDVSQLPLVAAP